MEVDSFSNLPVPLSKEGSTFLSKPLFPQGRENVAGAAIALPEFWYRQRSLCPQGAADDFLRNRVIKMIFGCTWQSLIKLMIALVCAKIAIVCAVLHRLAESLLAVFALIYAWFALK